MNLKIVRYLSTGVKDTLEFDLDKYFILSPGELSLRINAAERYEQDGGEETGDEKASPRKIRLSRDEAATNDVDYLAKLNATIAFLKAPTDSNGVTISSFYIEDATTARRAQIKLAGVRDENDRTLIRRLGRTGFDMLWLNSVWEDITETEVISAATPTGTSIALNVPGSLSTDCIITVEPISSTLSEITLRNTANGAAMTISAANLVVGSILEIDGMALGGTVRIINTGGTITDVSAAVADNTGFIPLQPGDNPIRYESAFGSADITIKFRNRAYF